MQDQSAEKEDQPGLFDRDRGSASGDTGDGDGGGVQSNASEVDEGEDLV